MAGERYRDLFLDEARRCLATLGRSLEAGPPYPEAALAAAHRSAHTLQGMAATMDLDEVRRLARAVEERLRAAGHGETALDPPRRDALLLAVRHLSDQVEAYARGASLPDPAAALARLEEG